MKNNEFYDSLSENYNSMLNFDNLVNIRTEALNKFIKIEYKNAIDIGCGTGADSIALTKNGMNVTGFDTSLKMLQKAKLNAKERNLKIKFSNSPIENIDNKNHSGFDIVVSLGNAIANINPMVLSRIFRKVFQLLKPDGSFLIQILNYHSVRKTNKRIVNITRGNGSVFVRFYDYGKDKLYFNILRINDQDLKDYKLIATELYEYKKAELKELLNKNGFNKIRFYSDLNKSRFETKSSKDLIILAEKII